MNRSSWSNVGWGGAALGAMVLLCACGGRTPMFGVPAQCGNGERETGEACDGADLGGATCADVGFETGTLACTAQCELDTQQCWTGGGCGDGLLGVGEACDCGTDPASLPTGCWAPNGAPGSGCALDCRIIGCGDGIRQFGEECDCGTDPASLPAGCASVNGDDTGGAFCTGDCLWDEGVCEGPGNWEACDPLVVDECCPDPWDVQLECTALPTQGGGTVCLRHCGATSDCYWHQYCLGPQFGSICWYAVCGPDTGVGQRLNDFCQVPGGGLGWCWPLIGRATPEDGMYGLCIEAGYLQPGGACPAGQAFDGTDRSEPWCEFGFCRAAQGTSEGLCTQFCHWEDAYAVAIYGADPAVESLPCPLGTNCFGDSSIDPTTGLRSGDLGYCLPTAAAEPATGLTTCSLITNQLLSDPSQTCASAGFNNGRCMMVQQATGTHTNGSLVGVCADTTAPTVSVWGLCQPAPSTDVCALGSVCVREDVFAVNPTGSSRCVPLCDTAHHDGGQADCQDLGAPAGAVCTSQSRLYPPNGPLDPYPTRLGLCALSPP